MYNKKYREYEKCCRENKCDPSEHLQRSGKLNKSDRITLKLLRRLGLILGNENMQAGGFRGQKQKALVLS